MLLRDQTLYDFQWFVGKKNTLESLQSKVLNVNMVLLVDGVNVNFQHICIHAVYQISDGIQCTAFENFWTTIQVSHCPWSHALVKCFINYGSS